MRVKLLESDKAVRFVLDHVTFRVFPHCQISLDSPASTFALLSGLEYESKLLEGTLQAMRCLQEETAPVHAWRRG